MSREKIGAIWLLGIVLALAVYAAGPDQALLLGWGMVTGFEQAIRNLQLSLSASAFDLVRSLAVGLFLVFVLLGLMAARRGLRARGALIVVSVMFVLLAGSGTYASGSRWFGALLLAGIGAAVMTRRLTQA